MLMGDSHLALEARRFALFTLSGVDFGTFDSSVLSYTASVGN